MTIDSSVLYSKLKQFFGFDSFKADQERIINSMTDSELAGIIEYMFVDDAVDMMEELPANDFGDNSSKSIFNKPHTYILYLSKLNSN